MVKCDVEGQDMISSLEKFDFLTACSEEEEVGEVRRDVEILTEEDVKVVL